MICRSFSTCHRRCHRRQISDLSALCTMSASWLLLIWVLPALCATQASIAPIACRTHDDCRTTRIDTSGRPLQQSLALCERELCTPLTKFTCKGANDCGYAWGCRAGKCVPGGLGATCRTDSANCMPGFSCDAATAKCVRGVAGVICRDAADCGFGHSCFFTKKKSPGVCMLGRLGTTACRRDMNCAGPLQCFQVGDRPWPHRCGRPIDVPTSPRPRTFGKCETDTECGIGFFSFDLVCIRGTCRTPNLGQSCKYQNDCGYYSYCRKGLCAPAVAGSPCESTNAWELNNGCEPGTRCNAPRATGLGRPGICVVGEEGMVCRDGRECKEGLMCGSSRICVKSAEGQRCLSNFWCPEGTQCSKKSRK